jgi:uncharacterized protein YciI
MEFDQFTVALLLSGPSPPQLDDEQATALQDAHLSYLADLHQDGHLIAAGPLAGGPDRRYRGISLFRSDAETTRELCAADPAVRAGRFVVEILPWMVPAGAIRPSSARFPRSVADATGN